jgi:hypothetical protein
MLTVVSRSFPQSLQTNIWIVPQVIPRALPRTPCSLQYSLITPSLKLLKASLNKRTGSKIG